MCNKYIKLNILNEFCNYVLIFNMIVKMMSKLKQGATVKHVHITSY